MKKEIRKDCGASHISAFSVGVRAWTYVKPEEGRLAAELLSSHGLTTLGAVTYMATRIIPNFNDNTTVPQQ